jgi:hypothetical protein
MTYEINIQPIYCEQCGGVMTKTGQTGGPKYEMSLTCHQCGADVVIIVSFDEIPDKPGEYLITMERQ